MHVMIRRLATRRAALGALLACATLASAAAQEPVDPPARVARVNLAIGSVSLEPAGSESWVSDVVNRPLANGDKLWADRESRIELHVGSSAVRLGSETGIGILNIDDRTVQLRLTAGTLQLRVRALAPEETFEIATPRASVAVLRPGEYRIEVSDSADQMQIAVAQGQLAVTDQGAAGTVEAGQLALYAGGPVDQPELSGLPPPDAFDDWVAERDRREDRAASTRYVSRDVTGYEDLDDYGSWRATDQYGPVWVPTVVVGWAPYRYGHWGWVAPWGWTWIDDAPWGFAPFHYGRWVSLGGVWCWAPGPRAYAPVYAPALVAWVGGPHFAVGVAVGAGGPPVGWVPLGWNEVYVPSYRVSNTYVQNVNVTNIHVTNTTINNYIVNNTTIVNGATVERPSAGRKYANLAVAGAMTATTQAAFTGAQPVARHLTAVSGAALAQATAGTAAPAIAPTASSIGRPAPAAPRAAPQLWSRPVVARTPPPPPPPSFEAQRRAVIANGGLPVANRAAAPVPANGAKPAGGGRADVIRVAPRPLPKPPAPTAAAAPPAPAAAPVTAAPREAAGRRADRPLPDHPAGPVAPTAPTAGAPVRAHDDRPPSAGYTTAQPQRPGPRETNPPAAPRPVAPPPTNGYPPAERPAAERTPPRPVAAPQPQATSPPAAPRATPPPEDRPATRPPAERAPPRPEAEPRPPHATKAPAPKPQEAPPKNADKAPSRGEPRER